MKYILYDTLYKEIKITQGRKMVDFHFTVLGVSRTEDIFNTILTIYNTIDEDIIFHNNENNIKKAIENQFPEIIV